MALITNLSPPAGTPVAADGVISFDVIDPLIAELRIFIWTVFADTGQVELVRDGDNFQPLYSTSSEASTPGGRTFSIRRVGGWTSQPQLRVTDCACPPEIVPAGIDTLANLGGGGEVGKSISGTTLNLRTFESRDGSVAVTEYPLTVDLSASSGTEPISDVAKLNIAAGTTVALAAGDRARAADMSVGGAVITLELPEIVADLDEKGSRCSFVVPTGNAGQALTVTPFAGNGVTDPANGSVVATVTYPTGTFTGYTVLTWEAVRDYGTALPGTLLSIAPSNVSGPFPNLGAVSFTLSGTGGTIPSVGNTGITLTPDGPHATLTTGGGDITVTGTTQSGGPGTAWTIDFDVLAGEFTLTFITFSIDVFDTAAPFGSATTAIGLGLPATLVDTGSGVAHVWVADSDYTGGPGVDWAAALAAGPDSGPSPYYLNTPQRAAIGTDQASHPAVGVNTTPSDFGIHAQRYDGSHTGTVTGTGGQATPVYHLDPIDILLSTATGAFDGVAVIEWVGVRFAGIGGMAGMGMAKERWIVGGGTTALAPSNGAPVNTGNPLYDETDTRNVADPVMRLAVGSTPRSIALEILDDLGSGTIGWEVWYRVTFINNVTAF